MGLLVSRVQIKDDRKNGFEVMCVFVFSLEEIQVPKNRALQIQAELSEQTQ